MQLAHAVRDDRHLRHSDRRRDREDSGVRDLHRSAAERRRRDFGELVSVRQRHRARGVGDGGRVRRGRLAGEDVQLGGGDVVEGGDVRLEVLCEDLLRQVRSPVGEL